MLRHKRNAQKWIALEYRNEIHLENMTKQITVHKIKTMRDLQGNLRKGGHVNFTYNSLFCHSFPKVKILVFLNRQTTLIHIFKTIAVKIPNKLTSHW